MKGETVKRLTLLTVPLVALVLAFALPAAAHHDGAATSIGHCWQHVPPDPPNVYQVSICGHVYLYVKNASNVWYISKDFYTGPSWGPTTYDQPVSSGGNFYAFAYDPRCGSDSSPVYHKDPGSTYDVWIFRHLYCQ